MLGMIGEMMNRFRPKTTGIFLWSFAYGEGWVKDFSNCLRKVYPGQAKTVATKYADLEAPNYFYHRLRIKTITGVCA